MSVRRIDAGQMEILAVRAAHFDEEPRRVPPGTAANVHVAAEGEAVRGEQPSPRVVEVGGARPAATTVVEAVKRGLVAVHRPRREGDARAAGNLAAHVESAPGGYNRRALPDHAVGRPEVKRAGEVELRIGAVGIGLLAEDHARRVHAVAHREGRAAGDLEVRALVHHQRRHLPVGVHRHVRAHRRGVGNGDIRAAGRGEVHERRFGIGRDAVRRRVGEEGERSAGGGEVARDDARIQYPVHERGRRGEEQLLGRADSRHARPAGHQQGAAGLEREAGRRHGDAVVELQHAGAAPGHERARQRHGGPGRRGVVACNAARDLKRAHGAIAEDSSGHGVGLLQRAVRHAHASESGEVLKQPEASRPLRGKRVARRALQRHAEPDSGSRMGRAHECVTGHRDVRPSKRRGLSRLIPIHEVDAAKRQARREFDVAEAVRRKRGYAPLAGHLRVDPVLPVLVAHLRCRGRRAQPHRTVDGTACPRRARNTRRHNSRTRSCHRKISLEC